MDDYFDLGTYSRPVTTASSDAQVWFDRGLVWLFAYNHEEAATCFQNALDVDPSTAMAGWGIAYALGPNYNRPWEIFSEDDKIDALSRAHAALAKAMDALDNVSPTERALITALAERYPENAETEDFAPWNDAFADAMRRVYAAHPGDLDVAFVFAEALMNRTPWALWDLPGGIPAEGASTEEARDVLEAAFANDPAAWDHPGLLHMYIHLMEMSPFPELALRHGDRLSGMVPGAGHLVHMATHIDVLTGDYQAVVERNLRAAKVDEAYKDHAGGENFYTLYRLHNLHFAAYGAMFLAQPEPAIQAAKALETELPEPVVRVYPEVFEAFLSNMPHILVRFGRWQEVLDLPIPEDRDLYAYTHATILYARAVALANLGRHDEAQTARAAFLEAEQSIPEERMMFNNSCRDVLKVARAMMEGEIAFKSSDKAAGLKHLRDAVAIDDALAYEEPWVWMQPTRHALGALLMEVGEYAEAETVYRADLGLDDTLSRPCQHPRNVWSLHGLHECLTRRGETAEARLIKLDLDRALARADIPIKASCFCRSGA